VTPAPTEQEILRDQRASIVDASLAVQSTAAKLIELRNAMLDTQQSTLAARAASEKRLKIVLEAHDALKRAELVRP
jgi:hypothetical protein